MLVLAGETDAAARAQAIYDLEKQIATVHWDKNDSSDATTVYNKMTIAELAKAAPSFDRAGFIRGVGVNEDMILVAQPSACTGEEKLLSSSPIAVTRYMLLVSIPDTVTGVSPHPVAPKTY